MTRLLWLTFALVSCSAGGGNQPTRLADGGYRLSCRGPLADCLAGADKVCRERGYRIAEGRDARELLGHEQGQSQIEIRKSEAVIYCGGEAFPAERQIMEIRSERPLTRPQREEAPAPVEPASPTVARACVPGSTQACVGPGGCSGGQACSADGSHFEPCDCGNAN